MSASIKPKLGQLTFQPVGGRWQWRFVINGTPMAMSVETYSRRRAAVRAWDRFGRAVVGQNFRSETDQTWELYRALKRLHDVAIAELAKDDPPAPKQPIGKVRLTAKPPRRVGGIPRKRYPRLGRGKK